MGIASLLIRHGRRQEYEDVSGSDDEAEKEEPEEVGKSGKRKQAQASAPSRPTKKAKGGFVVEPMDSEDEAQSAKKVSFVYL